MANGVNRVILIGNLGRDPEVQNFENGVKKATFTLATTESYKDKDGQKTSHTEWHNIVLWRGLADVADRFLKKGNTVYIEGKIRKREYEDKEGQKKSIYEVLADNMQMLSTGPRPDGTGTPPPPAGQQSETPMMNTAEDDLPF